MNGDSDHDVRTWFKFNTLISTDYSNLLSRCAIGKSNIMNTENSPTQLLINIT